MKNSLAICYLTHDHPDIVKDILDRSLADCEAHGIDVYYYDDSNNDDTLKLIEQYREEGHDNLFRVDIHEAVNADHKMLLIMQGKGLLRDYDYIWPIKDRVCFTSAYLDKICEALDKDPDVIMGCNEGQRWDVSRVFNKEEYTDPVQFYRDYCFFATNWESTIRRRSTMLTPIDWERYTRDYSISPNNPFNQLVTTFVRFSELDGISARIVHYEPDERYIAPFGGSSWRNVMFELWIDKWTAANFSLPSIYDPYKLEVIKSETNLFEVMGSVEWMMKFHEDGFFTKEVVDKYRNVWPVITDIPVKWLELITESRYEDVIREVLNDFDKALAEHDYHHAHWLIASNTWFEQMYEKNVYSLLCKCFIKFREDMLTTGYSEVFDGIGSVEDIKIKFSNYL